MTRTHIPEKVQRRITKAVSAARQKFEEGEPFTPVPGMLLMDFENVLYTLNTIAGLFPEMPKGGKVLLFLDVSLGASYGEERTPEYVLPDPSTNMVILIAQQLPMLYSAFVDRIAETGSGFDRMGGLASSFMRLMEEFFRSRKATVEVVLACVFWMKSVVALQGNADLGRNVSLTFKHSTRLMGIMEAWLERRPEANVQYSKRFIAVLKECGRGQQVARSNPLMAGFLELDNDLQFLRIANDLAMAASIFRAFGHLYNALVNEGYLNHIPFFDDVLGVFEQMIFTPSKATAVRGAYYRTYLLSRGFSTTGVRAVYRGAISSRNESFRDRKKPHMEDLSQIYRLLHQRDTSALKGTSVKDLLHKVADICAKELFETRVLSRDMVTLNDDLADTLCEMFDELSEGYLDQLPDPVPGESQKARVNRALENLMPVLGLLDSLQLDGTMDRSMIPAEARYEDVGNMRVHEGCRKISAVIKTKFLSSPRFCEEKYFTYPAQPDFVRQEYGSASLKGDFEKANREKVFSELMKLLQTNNGPLGESDLDHLQAEIKKDPALLCMVCPQSESDKDHSMPGSDVTSSSDNDLCTLFHQAAAGPAHDLYLVEWMIQMGALVNQPLHCRTKTRQRNVKHDGVILSNAMAVHSAAIAGFKDIVCTIVGADNMMDLNTSTFYTSETLAHLAVKRGHRSLYELLASVGADLSLRDGNGKRVCDVTTEQEWRCEMVSRIVQRKTSLGSTKGKAHGEALMEELRQSVSPHLEKKLQRSVSSSSKRKAKEKKRGGANGSANASEFSSTAVSDPIAAKLSGQMKQLLLSSNLTSDENDADNSSNRNAELHDLFNNAAATFQRLSDPSTPADMKVEDEERACKLVTQLESVAKFLSHPNRLNATDPSLRVFVAKKSFETIHMMQKLHRVTDPAITVPLLGPVKELCDTTLDFTEFIVGTAQLLASFSRNSQAREILDVLEKRLLKTPFDKRKPSEFRALVQMYSSARDTMGMGSTSSPKT
ncbi:hypothetical protein PR001_g24237 [Phytophthora rubi]|uniref:Uncharacterized protein n=1 Tax=Phytophthora rubi TaxID=129364 RepID=A0A6A3IJ64_9STRA|nr:hypothetical protein PR002_g24600 [Phytophthora rubi]KAE8980605.1 hypothetical protein PR001_g24237 [Phytophthora rubi]